MIAGERYLSTDGSLRVVPYEHTYVASVKGRWLGRTLIDAFTSEFASVVAPAHDEGEHTGSVSTSWKDNLATYAGEMSSGTLRIRGREEECRLAGAKLQQCIPSAVAGSLAEAVALLPPVAVLRQNEWVEHSVRRCEGHVPNFSPVEIVACHAESSESLRYLGVNKPPGIPVHPSGKFHKLSVTRILEDVLGGVDGINFEKVANDDGSIDLRHARHKYTLVRLASGLSRQAADYLSGLVGPCGGTKPIKVFVVHRLDTCTSGVLLFGLDTSSARRMTAVVSEKTDESAGCCAKEYVARVRGDFRTLHVDSDTVAGDKWILLRRPIFCRSYFDSTYGCPSDIELADLRSKAGGTSFAATTTFADPTVTKDCVENVTSPAVKRQRDEPLLSAPTTLAEKHALMKARAVGARSQDADPMSSIKEAASLFRWVAQVEGDSLVACRPLSGRTHQLRVHLAWLGFPIANDGKYCPHMGDDDTAGTTHTADGASIFLHSRRYELRLPQADGGVDNIVVETAAPPWAVGA